MTLKNIRLLTSEEIANFRIPPLDATFYKTYEEWNAALDKLLPIKGKWQSFCDRDTNVFWIKVG